MLDKKDKNSLGNKFNFDQIIDRTEDNSDKWQAYGEGILPMWIADMDFQSPPVILDTLKTLVGHGVFGYGQGRPPELIQTIQNRMLKKYHWAVDTESIVFLPGLVCGMNVFARALSLDEKGHTLPDLVAPSEASIMTNTPIYPPFLSTPLNQGFKSITVPLSVRLTGEHNNIWHYSMDADSLKGAAQPNTVAFMLCSPHNPSGRIFTRDELLALEAVATEKNWAVLSDDIHAELLLDQNQHTPYALINERARAHTVSLFAPSKTFNIAGLGASFAIIENPVLRQKFKRAMQGLIPSPNYLAMAAMQAAFTGGDEWLCELNQYLTANRDYAIAALSKIPNLKMTKPEASFLLWIDFRETKIANNPFQALLDQGLALNNGPTFGDVGKGFVRLNFGCPRATLIQGIEIIKKTLEN